jgi:precorrin-6B methylase 2
MLRVAPIALLLACSALFAADAPVYEHRDVHDPDGIGKFYMGREIAHVMGPGGIIWLERPEREVEEQPQRVIDALDIRAGQTVVDLGAGSGYYSFRIAPLVGPAGKVIAVDIEPEMLRVIQQRAEREQVNNLVTVRSAQCDPNLPAASVDLLFMVDVYHELSCPYEMMQKVALALKPGGRVALIEFRKEDPKVTIKEVHKMSVAQIVKEMNAVGLKHKDTVETLPIQHLVIFAK